MTRVYFNLLNSLDNLLNKIQEADTDDLFRRNVFNFKNCIFSQLLKSGVPYVTETDWELDNPEYDFVVITDSEGKKYRCRKKFLALNSPNSDLTGTSQKVGTQISPELTDKISASMASVPVSKISEPEFREDTTPTKDLNKPNYSESEALTPSENPVTVKADADKQPENNSTVANISSFATLMSGKATVGIAPDDMTMELKDITMDNRIKNTATIVNLTTVPLTPDDGLGKSEILTCASGFSDIPIVSYSTAQNLTAKIDIPDNSFGISGGWENGKFKTSIISLSESSVEENPDDCCLYQNKDDEVGHNIVEIQTPTKERFVVHAFPISFENNEKGSADCVICVESDMRRTIKVLDIDKPMFNYHSREFDAKIMSYWQNGIFYTTVELTLKG